MSFVKNGKEANQISSSANSTVKKRAFDIESLVSDQNTSPDEPTKRCHVDEENQINSCPSRESSTLQPVSAFRKVDKTRSLSGAQTPLLSSSYNNPVNLHDFASLSSLYSLSRVFESQASSTSSLVSSIPSSPLFSRQNTSLPPGLSPGPLLHQQQQSTSSPPSSAIAGGLSGSSLTANQTAGNGKSMIPASLLPFLPPSLAALSFPQTNWCAKCNATFRMTSDLVYHMRSHHKKESTTDPLKKKREDKLRCNICGETFRERHHLTRHMTSHQ